MQINNFYFTFGTDEAFPFQGGWVIVKAPDMMTARQIFMLYFPSVSGYLNCAFVYSEEEFKKTKMYKDGENMGAGCHMIIGPHPEDWRIEK